MTSPSDNVDELAIWDVVRNRSQSSRCVSLSSFSGSLDNSHSVEMNQSCQYNKTFVCCNAWCVTLRQKRNTASLHPIFLRDKQLDVLKYSQWSCSRSARTCIYAANASDCLTSMHLACAVVSYVWKGKRDFQMQFLFRKMSHAHTW